MKNNGPTTGNEVTFGHGDNLITTTNTKGAITYFNPSFHKVSGFNEQEMMGKNHNLVRHPEMPVAAFKDLWDTLHSNKSWMGIVKNRCKNGDHYYVDAYVTPISEQGSVSEYQSVRVKPEKKFIERAEALYNRLNLNKSAIRLWHKVGFVSRLMGGFSLLLVALLAYSAAIGQLTLAQLIPALVVGLLMSFGLSRLIASPLLKLAAESRQAIDNDLARQVYGGSQDEVAQLRLALHMKDLESNSVIARLDDSSDQLKQVIQRTSQIAQETQKGVEYQFSEIEQLSAAMSEMSATVQEVARNTSSASEAAQSADGIVATGKKDMSDTVKSISEVAEVVKVASNVVTDLQVKSESIGSVLDVIRGIADQTNLLALNAAIEAARAGEQGRGFAVVADEVRSLARRTQESTQEIQTMIENMQNGTQNAVEAMMKGCDHVETSVQQAEKAGQSLEQIADIVKSIADMNIQIASATEEQRAVSEEVNSNVNNISDEARKNADNSQLTQQTVTQLEEFSNHLQGLVSQFKKQSGVMSTSES